MLPLIIADLAFSTPARFDGQFFPLSGISTTPVFQLRGSLSQENGVEQISIDYFENSQLILKELAVRSGRVLQLYELQDNQQKKQILLRKK